MSFPSGYPTSGHLEAWEDSPTMKCAVWVYSKTRINARFVSKTTFSVVTMAANPSGL